MNTTPSRAAGRSTSPFPETSCGIAPRKRPAVTRQLGTCRNGSLRDLRDRTILMVAFGSAGLHRSEIASLRREQITEEEPVELKDCTRLPSISIHLGRTKNSDDSCDPS